MVLKSWQQWVNRKTKSRRRGECRAQRRKSPWRPSVEYLEDRLVPATFTWDGVDNAGNFVTSSNWSNPLNWAGDVAPNPAANGQIDLIFPATATNLVNNDDLAVG